MKLKLTINRSPGFLMNNLNKMNMNIELFRRYNKPDKKIKIIMELTEHEDNDTWYSFHEFIEDVE